MKKTYVAAVMFLGIAGTVFFAWSKGPVSTTKQAQQADVKGISTEGTKTLQYNELSVVVPGRFKLRSSTPVPQKPLFVQQLFTTQESGVAALFGEQLAVTIGEVSSGLLQDVSDVTLRQRSSAYVSLPTELQRVYIFESKVSQYEIGMFGVSGSRYVGVVLSGPLAKQEQLRKELEAAAATVMWR
jgi:hypothetical protein